MRWQKRGKGHNSLNGQEAVMGLSSGNCWTIQQGQKVVDFVIVPKPWKNNPKLMTAEKAMEPASGVELFIRAPDQSVKFSVYRVMMTHDDDDELHIREKVTYELEKTVTLYI